MFWTFLHLKFIPPLRIIKYKFYKVIALSYFLHQINIYWATILSLAPEKKYGIWFLNSRSFKCNWEVRYMHKEIFLNLPSIKDNQPKGAQILKSLRTQKQIKSLFLQEEKGRRTRWCWNPEVREQSYGWPSCMGIIPALRLHLSWIKNTGHQNSKVSWWRKHVLKSVSLGPILALTLSCCETLDKSFHLSKPVSLEFHLSFHLSKPVFLSVKCKVQLDKN